jgi:DNA-binding response OmpR family regulator
MKHILLAEDDGFIRELIESAFNDAAFNVVSVSDGEAVIPTLLAQPIHIVILDLDLPHVDGLTLLKQIKADERFLSLPVLIFTNQDQTSLKEQVEKEGGNYYFKALTDMNELRTDVIALLA